MDTNFLIKHTLRIPITCAAIMMLLSPALLADAQDTERWSKQYQVDYTLGDNDSRATAREIALDKLRLLAAADAGKYIQGDERLKDGKYSQSIHMAAATIVSLSDIKETMSVNGAGQPVLHISASATVDNAELKKRIAALQQDQAQAKRLAGYERKMNGLIGQLEKLSQLKSVPDAEINAVEMKKEALIRNLHAAMRSADVEFEKGSIVAIANTAHKEKMMLEANEKRKMMLDINRLEKTLLSTIFDKTKLTVRVKERGIIVDDNHKYTIPVELSLVLPYDDLANNFFGPDIERNRFNIRVDGLYTGEYGDSLDIKIKTYDYDDHNYRSLLDDLMKYPVFMDGVARRIDALDNNSTCGVPDGQRWKHYTGDFFMISAFNDKYSLKAASIINKDIKLMIKVYLTGTEKTYAKFIPISFPLPPKYDGSSVTGIEIHFTGDYSSYSKAFSFILPQDEAKKVTGVKAMIVNQIDDGEGLLPA